MADTKITALTALTAADPANDVIPIVDVSDTTMAASGTTKKISVNNLLSSSPTASGALTVTGLVTAGSATITGDLTVRTDKLAVRSTGVGIGTTSVLADLNIQNGSNCRCEFASQAGGTVIENLNNARNAYLNMTMYADAYIWNRLGSEAMRLNANGLGVGGSPTSKLGIFAGADGDIGLFRGGSTRQVQLGTSATAGYLNTDNGSAGLEIRTQGVARAYVDNSGNVGIGVTPAGTGGCLQLKSGITFPATQVASADANTLDDYEEGTWAIGLEFGGASTGITTNSNQGKYTKIGNQVTINGYLALSNKGSSTGNAVITGLPFLANGYTAVSLYMAQITFADVPMGFSNNGTSTIILRESTNAGVSSTLTNADFANNSEIMFNMTYFV